MLDDVRIKGASQWLALCGLFGRDGESQALIDAAVADFARSESLQTMLKNGADVFVRWWHGQDVAAWALTEATGNTDWALLVLARAASAKREVRLGLAAPIRRAYATANVLTG